MIVISLKLTHTVNDLASIPTIQPNIDTDSVLFCF